MTDKYGRRRNLRWARQVRYRSEQAHLNSGAIKDEALARVWRVLNRSIQVQALKELLIGLNSPQLPLSTSYESNIAFAFDTNAIFRVGLGGIPGDNAVDYLRNSCAGRIIVPGQCIQEVWNNALAGIGPQAKKVRNQFELLKTEMKAIDQQLGPAAERAGEALDEFVEFHGDWIDPNSHAVVKGALEALLANGVTTYVPRMEFAQLAQVRHETKAPPGFRDSANNHGDFYVWADFLYGLASMDTTKIEAVVMVTNDAKPDWIRNGVAHPLLVAEAVAVGRVPFGVWTVKEFQQFASNSSSG